MDWYDNGKTEYVSYVFAKWVKFLSDTGKTLNKNKSY